MVDDASNTQKTTCCVRRSFEKFPELGGIIGIASVNKEMYVESFVALGVRSEGNVQNSG